MPAPVEDMLKGAHEQLSRGTKEGSHFTWSPLMEWRVEHSREYLVMVETLMNVSHATRKKQREGLGGKELFLGL